MIILVTDLVTDWTFLTMMVISIVFLLEFAYTGG